MTELRELVLAAIRSESDRWYPGIATYLATATWVELRPIGLNKATYGTTRMLALDSTAPRKLLASLRAGRGSINIEALSVSISRRYGPLGLDAIDISPELAIARISAGLELIGAVPTMLESIGELVRSLHLIGTEGPDYDASYSDPDLPFSIFVGLHSERTPLDAVRLAESLVHEAMHLQLSLIERHVPLLVASDTQRYSPWQHRLRPPQGILHGLYVFRAIQDFLTKLPSDALGEIGERHRLSRIREIEKQCRQLDGFQETADLTDEGRNFVNLLLGFESQQSLAGADEALKA